MSREKTRLRISWLEFGRLGGQGLRSAIDGGQTSPVLGSRVYLKDSARFEHAEERDRSNLASTGKEAGRPLTSASTALV